MVLNKEDVAVVNAVVNKDWPDSIDKGVHYNPWVAKDTWKSVECHNTEKGFVLYRTVEDDSNSTTKETEPLQILRVEWLMNYGGSNLGYCVRIKDTSEIVAIIQQEDMNAWHWEFMLKYETAGLSQLEKKYGWVSQKLLSDTIHQVFRYLIEEE